MWITKSTPLALFAALLLAGCASASHAQLAVDPMVQADASVQIVSIPPAKLVSVQNRTLSSDFLVQVSTRLTMTGQRLNYSNSAQPNNEGCMLEGRKQPRTATRLLVNIFSVRDPHLTDLASIENLSSRGARVVTQRPWELGSHVGIRAISGAMSASARVVYCQPIVKDFAVGLNFLTQFR